MPRILVTGGGGLIGSEVCEQFHARGWDVFSIDNDQRGRLFGSAGSVRWNLERLARELSRFTNLSFDVRDIAIVHKIFSEYQFDAVVHCAAQPAHEGNVLEDFSINVKGTLNVLGAWKEVCPDAPFVHLSTIKVYGCAPNEITGYCAPNEITGYYRKEHRCRYDFPESHRYCMGFDESLPIDMNGATSFFSRSKLAGELYAQEYAYRWNLPLAVFRPSCVTGGHHAGTEAHGMLAYMMKCAFLQEPYTVYGYNGFQVRDQLHVSDLAIAVEKFIETPHRPVVYNIGGGRERACSVLEAIDLCEQVTGNKMRIEYGPERIGDHKWWITDAWLFRRTYSWEPQVSLDEILQDIYVCGRKRWVARS